MFKRFLLITSSNLLKLSLFMLALTGAAWMVFGTADSTKKSLDESNIYTTIVDSGIEGAKKAAKKENESFPVDNPEVEAAIRNAFPIDSLQSNGESVIDAIYAWLSGQSAQPQFTVDLTEAKQKLADGVAEVAKKRYEGLPVCTIAQLQSMNVDKINPFNIPCRSPLVSSNEVTSQVRAEILNSTEFLGDPILTAEDLPKDKQGKTFTENLSAAPGVYGALKSMPWVLAALSMLFAVAVIFLSTTKLQGVKSIGITLLGTGLFLAISTLLISWLFGRMNQPGGSIAIQEVQEGITRTVRSLVDTYNDALRSFYVGYILSGGGILATLWFRSRSQKRAEELPSEQKSTTVTTPAKPKDKPEQPDNSPEKDEIKK